MKKIMLFVVIAIVAVGNLKAQTPDPDTSAKHFVMMASIGNLQEIKSGELAIQKAMRADVKAFGTMMVTDHQQAQKKLLALAKSKGYNIPPEATGFVVPDLDLKNAASGFDRVYTHAMASAHGKTVNMFQNYADTGKDPDVRAFAQQTLPTLKQHLAEIKAIDDKIKDVAK